MEGSRSVLPAEVSLESNPAECFMALLPGISCGPLSPERPYSFNRSIHETCLRAAFPYLSPSDKQRVSDLDTWTFI